MFTLDDVVPWGRSFGEYQRMFALSDGDLRRRIVGCADGPASFNAEATERGAQVVSCDPVYRWAAHEIRTRIEATAPGILDETRLNAHEFVWDMIPSVDALGDIRMSAMRTFLEDFAATGAGRRYVAAALPVLPFTNGSFDLALCSHFLFLYSAHLTSEFHCAAVREMCRVAREVRIFPLLALGGARSPHVDLVQDDLRDGGFSVSVEDVPYEFQRGGNQMMRVCRSTGG
jgi:hypothetical protein